jgi:hypothetical protein
MGAYINAMTIQPTACLVDRPSWKCCSFVNKSIYPTWMIVSFATSATYPEEDTTEVKKKYFLS